MKITIKRSQRKTAVIRIIDQEVVVFAPHSMSDQVIHRWVDEKKELIKRKQFSMPKRGFEHSVVSLFGSKYEVVATLSDMHELRIGDDQCLISYTDQKTPASILETYAVDALKTFINERVAFYCMQMQVEQPPIKYRYYESMHGRCHRNGELAFNLWLVHYPWEFIEYVVIHECAHLIEFNHSKAFYQIIVTYMPHFKTVIASLNFE